MIVCLKFHTAVIIHRKNWRIIIKLHFENFATPLPPPVRFCSLFNDTPYSPQRTYFLNDPLPVLLLLVSHQFLYQQISFFYNFFELRLALSQKDFCLKFSLFNGFTQTPHTLNSRNLLIATIFLSIFLKMPSDFFLIFAVKILRKHLLCISSELPLYIYFWRFQLPILWCSYQNIFQEPLF